MPEQQRPQQLSGVRCLDHLGKQQRTLLLLLLSRRAAKTLMIYLMETNANVYSWLVDFYKKNPIPRVGALQLFAGPLCATCLAASCFMPAAAAAAVQKQLQCVFL